MSIAFRVCLVVLVPTLVCAQYRPPGRYDLPPDSPSMGGMSDPRAAMAGTSAGTGHTTWPTHAMHGADRGSGIQPVGYDQSPAEFADELPSGSSLLNHQGNPPARPRQQVWQPQHDDGPACDEVPWIVPYQTKLRSTVLPGNGDDLGVTDLDARMTLAIPALQGFTITPGGIVGFVDGPLRTDLPANLYSAWIELQYMQQLSQQWALQVAVAPGIYSDFDNTDTDAFRITGRALAFFATSVQTQFVFGVVYLDREDVSVLPAAGIIHSPTENLKLELLFPRPRVLFNVMRTANGDEAWVYLAGEFGGGSWAIQRAGGANDVATYSDLRIIAGYERKYASGRSWLVEGGWVFNRSLEYTSGLGDYDPESTGLIRAGLTF